MPKFSIIVNCLNGEQFLERSLNSIYNQTLVDWEVIFYDNNSSDSSSDIAKSYGSKLKYFKSEETSTLGKARDNAVRLAKGTFIAYLDVDDEWDKTKLESQLILFDQSVDFVFTNTTITDDKKNSFELFKYSQPSKGMVLNELLKRDFIPTSSIAIKRKSILSMETIYDHNLTLECDRDFILRLSEKFACNYTNECLTKRFIHAKNTIYTENSSSFFELNHLKNKITKIHASSDESRNIFIANIDEKIARSYWNKGENVKARSIFKQHKDIKRQKLFYILTFFLPRKLNMLKVSAIVRKIRNLLSIQKQY